MHYGQMISWRDKHAGMKLTRKKHLDYNDTENTDPDNLNVSVQNESYKIRYPLMILCKYFWPTLSFAITEITSADFLPNDVPISKHLSISYSYFLLFCLIFLISSILTNLLYILLTKPLTSTLDRRVCLYSRNKLTLLNAILFHSRHFFPHLRCCVLTTNCSSGTYYSITILISALYSLSRLWLNVVYV